MPRPKKSETKQKPRKLLNFHFRHNASDASVTIFHGHTERRVVGDHEELTEVGTKSAQFIKDGPRDPKTGISAWSHFVTHDPREACALAANPSFPRDYFAHPEDIEDNEAHKLTQFVDGSRLTVPEGRSWLRQVANGEITWEDALDALPEPLEKKHDVEPEYDGGDMSAKEAVGANS